MPPIERIQRYGRHGAALLGAVGAVVVIQSLRDDDNPTGLWLYELIEGLARPYGPNLTTHYKTAQRADQLEFLLQELAGYVALSGRAPILHLECHGHPDGIQLADGSGMSWGRLKPLLTDINLASKMNMLFTMASCHGGYFAAECRYDEPVPFAYVIGPGNKIAEGALYHLTDGFYSELFKSWDVTKALTAGGGGREDISYFSMSAVGIFRLALTARIKGTDRARRIIEEPIFDQLKRKFFALDQFPENASRFAISYAEVCAEVEADEPPHEPSNDC